MSSTATHPAADQAADAWKASIQTQLDQFGDIGDNTHAVIWLPDDSGEAQLLDLAESKAAALVAAEDRSTKVEGGELTVISLANLEADAPPAIAAAPEPDVDVDKPKVEGQNADKGKLFDIPPIVVDLSQPSKIGVSFSGDIDVTDREDPRWAKFYNDLAHGKSRQITVTVFTKGATKTHRRDKDGNVDAVVETKSIRITDVHLEDE